MEAFAPQFAQLLAIGLLWVTVHCSGMCGPIVAGLSAPGTQSSAKSNGRGWWTQALRVLAYQGGRAVTYLALGAAAGLAGHAAESVIGQVGGVASLAMAAVLIGGGLARIAGVDSRLGELAGAGAGRFVGQALGRMRHIGSDHPYLRMSGFGLVLGLLPCMLMFWVLGLAASTASVTGGALVMVGLVVLTTPVLIVAGQAPLLFRRPRLRRLGERIIPFAVVGSGVWLALVGAAANGWIAHQHFVFEAFGDKLMVMFW